MQHEPSPDARPDAGVDARPVTGVDVSKAKLDLFIDPSAAAWKSPTTTPASPGWSPNCSSTASAWWSSRPPAATTAASPPP